MQTGTATMENSLEVPDKTENLPYDPAIQKTKIMASSPITSWQIDGETVADFILGGSKITVGRLLLLLLSHFSRVRLCATPQTAVHQVPPSLGFSRQEHWSGLPFPSPMHESEK